MELSVIIVSFNVRYFLEQCLLSVRKASAALDAEVIVVDNGSTDGTVQMLRQSFPEVILIANQANLGYSRANNIGLDQSQGRVVLFLNPDTIVPETCFSSCLLHLQNNPNAGALGVKMIDGTGQFLPESKRGFPGGWNAFTRMSGLSGAFPSSKIFAGYYLGHMDRDRDHQAEVLSGAFMMCRKTVLDQVGAFDERFFMYAEDIDLSFRINKAGYSTLYFAGTTVIHFKGESTFKDAVYLRRFYEAMMLFVDKHNSGISGAVKSAMLKAAIRVRWAIAAFASHSGSPVAQRDPADFKLHGDPQSVELVQRALAMRWPGAVPATTAASVSIYCEGTAFGFTDIIREMQQQPQGVVYLYAAGANALVGSSRRDTRGEVIVLQPK